MSILNFACDFGFSAVKWVYGNRRGRLSSAFRQSGGKYLLGDDALAKVGASMPDSLDRIVDMYPAVVDSCMLKADVAEDVTVAVGLPYNFWLVQKDISGGAVDIIEASVARLKHVSSVLVCPQGFGGIRMFLDECQKVNGFVLSIDIGFNTVVWSLFDADTGNLVCGNTLYGRGVLDLTTTYLLPEISRFVPARKFNRIELSMLVEQGVLLYGLKIIDIKQDIKIIAENYMLSILDDITKEMQVHSGKEVQVDHLLLFGGGAHWVKDAAKQRMGSVIVLKNPEFANVSGFTRLLEGFGA